MRRAWCVFVGLIALATLAGCKPGWFESREPWRREAEEQCLKSGAVRETAAIAMLRPIEGPGICGADYPLKVAALGEGELMAYSQELRPPGLVPQTGSAPQRVSLPAPSPSPSSPYPRQSYGYSRPGYDPAPPVQQSGGAPLSLDPMQASGGAAARTYDPAHPMIQSEPLQPMPDTYRGALPRNDQRDDYSRAPRQSYPYPEQGPFRGADDAPATTAPALSPRLGPVPLGRQRPIPTTASVKPAATLACPIVSALDAWIKDAVQPAAMRWFNQPVAEIRQISAYSCRGMNGQPGARISEHAFGNALDIAAFTLSDGRKITVKGGWRGAPEEQGFLRDVQAAACEQFTTVLAPGSNAFHYDHIHVDLMRRASGRRICQPGAVSGEVVAARAAARNGGAYARQQDPAPRRELIEPNDDPFAWRGGNRRDIPTGSIAKGQTAGSKRAQREDPVDDEHILHED